MEYLEYNQSFTKDILKSHNILIDDKSGVADGVKLYDNVCIISSEISANSIIHNNCVIKNSKIGANSEIFSSEIEDSVVGVNCKVGPFAHIRGNTILSDEIRIGNFVEIKNSKIGMGSKMAHLAYIGDAEIGGNCNIGCGVVFCNYNGKIKQKTIVGDNVFIGSNANLIAPLKIGDGAFIAAGSTINKDVMEGEFAIARERQTNKKNFKNPYFNSKK